jgi:7-cyano-7-deazaguanine reductase
MRAPKHGVLGESTEYQFEYNPALLFAIPRQEGRALLSITAELPFKGFDRWTAYELSWLNAEGMPQAMIAEFEFSCASESIIESKSLKLYLNSFNQTQFASIDHVKETIANDLSHVSGTQVNVSLYGIGEYGLLPDKNYVSLDALSVSCADYLPNPQLLSVGEEYVSRKLSTHLFRSLCPVTGQPDWASVFIDYSGKAINDEGLIKYLVSYRNHQGFHEQCVEQIFIEIMRCCQPEQLTVYARFIRRGGLDINPLRSSHLTSYVLTREVRQ